MPLFQCQKCGAVENTATGNYWTPLCDGGVPECSECETGAWHGKFRKKNAFTEGYFTDGKYIYGPAEVEEKDGIFIWSYNKSFVMKGKVKPHDPLNPKALPKPTE